MHKYMLLYGWVHKLIISSLNQNRGVTFGGFWEEE